MEENKELGHSLIDSVGKPILDDIGSDLSEVVLDSFLDDGIFREVPIVGTILGMSKSAIRLNDYLFTKKVLKFLNELSSTSVEEKEEFLKKLDDKKKEKELGETLILYLDRHENFKKPGILAKVFQAYVRNHLTSGQFHLIAASIDKASVQDIEALVELIQKQLEYRKREDYYHLSHLERQTQVVAKNLYGAGLSNINLEVESDKSLGQQLISQVGVSFVLKLEAELLAKAVLNSWE